MAGAEIVGWLALSSPALDGAANGRLAIARALKPKAALRNTFGPNLGRAIVLAFLVFIMARIVSLNAVKRTVFLDLYIVFVLRFVSISKPLINGHYGR